VPEPGSGFLTWCLKLSWVPPPPCCIHKLFAQLCQTAYAGLLLANNLPNLLHGEPKVVHNTSHSVTSSHGVVKAGVAVTAGAQRPPPQPCPGLLPVGVVRCALGWVAAHCRCMRCSRNKSAQ
jgi:hypothetical protein